MRRFLVASLILAGLLAGAGPARAGVYNLSATDDIQDIWPLGALTNYAQIKLYLASLRLCEDRAQKEDQKPDRRRVLYLAQLAPLRLKQSANALCTLDRVDLGACLIRLGRNTAAITVLGEGLNEMTPDDPARFLILANLATAWHNHGELERAIGYQEQALAAWPTNWPGWGMERTLSYRRIERSYLDLLRLRSREMGRWTSVDDLFPGVKFDDPREKYQAGSIPPKMFDRLPTDAQFIVLQLLIWHPNDERLLWLYGEIRNAWGDIFAAGDIFKELVSSRGMGNVPALVRHRQELMLAIEKNQAFINAASKTPFLAQRMLWAFQPRCGLLSPGIGVAAVEANSLLAPVVYQQWLIDVESGKIAEDRKAKQDAAPPFVLEWRQIIVAFVFGLFTAILVRAQVQEWRRRGVGLTSPPEPSPRETPEQSEEPVGSGSSGKSELAP